jgi:hypothetical protein
MIVTDGGRSRNWFVWWACLSEDPVGQMCDARGVHDVDQLQLDVRVDAVEQPHPAAQQDGDDAEVDLVEQPGAQTLLDRLSAHQRDVLVAGGAPVEYGQALFAIEKR